MEKLHENYEAPRIIATNKRRELIEKATEIILVAEEKQSLCDRMAELFDGVEIGQVYPVNTFR